MKSIREHDRAMRKLERPDLSYEEVGTILAEAYEEIDASTFVNVFLASVDLDQFDSDTGHVDCPIACVEGLLAYQAAGGKVKSGGMI